MKLPFSLMPLCLALVAAPVLADDDCDVPMQRWQPREAVLEYATRQGWQVQRLKIDDGCYQIRGRDGQGRAFKAQLDPETLRVVKMAWRDHDDHERDREGADPSRQDAAPAPAPTQNSSPVLTPGTTPRGQIE